MQNWIEYVREHAWAGAGLVAIASFFVAWIIELLVLGLAARLVAKTETTLDDALLAHAKRPIYLTVLAIGLGWALAIVAPPAPFAHIARATLQTLVILVWTIALVRMGAVLLRHLSKRGEARSLFQPRTQPVFDIVLKTLVLGIAAYLSMVAWRIDVGAWVASAGIVGIAVGFAARDSLANYFSGLVIIADAPYKLGDVIVLDDGTRGRVTDIGLRSTRILTRDDIEINIPNSVLGNMKIVNASAGPTAAARMTVDVSVAYGADPAFVDSVLKKCVEGTPHITDHEPVVYFVEMGESGLKFKLHAWIEDAGLLEVVRHELNVRAYNALRDAGIEIPFPKMDVYVKDFPSARHDAGGRAAVASGTKPTPGGARP